MIVSEETKIVQSSGVFVWTSCEIIDIIEISGENERI